MSNEQGSPGIVYPGALKVKVKIIVPGFDPIFKDRKVDALSLCTLDTKAQIRDSEDPNAEPSVGYKLKHTRRHEGTLVCTAILELAPGKWHRISAFGENALKLKEFVEKHIDDPVRPIVSGCGEIMQGGTRNIDGRQVTSGPGFIVYRLHWMNSEGGIDHPVTIMDTPIGEASAMGMSGSTDRSGTINV